MKPNGGVGCEGLQSSEFAGLALQFGANALGGLTLEMEWSSFG